MSPTPPPYRGRFAPSPTGPLHFGSLVAALGSYLDARHHGGAWLIRVDDIDPPREVPGAAKQIIEMLACYGMVPDEPVLYQSSRRGAYDEALQKLERAGVLFPCACSRRDLALTGVYPGTCRGGLPPGRPARSLRLRVDSTPVSIHDRIQGRYEQRLDRDVGDFVVRRADGHVAYHLANVVDDADQAISHIVRGCDLLDSTPRQIYLQKMLGLPTPDYAHLPLVMGSDGAKLSKQTAATPVDEVSRVPTLIAALRFLGQAAPERLARGPLEGVWNWAQENWRLDLVPMADGNPQQRKQDDE